MHFFLLLIVTRARKENRIANDYMMLALIEQIDKFRGLAGGLINHDWVTIPLVYTQVVTLAVYTFLLSTLMGRQFLNPVSTINNSLDGKGKFDPNHFQASLSISLRVLNID